MTFKHFFENAKHSEEGTHTQEFVLRVHRADNLAGVPLGRQVTLMCREKAHKSNTTTCKPATASGGTLSDSSIRWNETIKLVVDVHRLDASRVEPKFFEFKTLALPDEDRSAGGGATGGGKHGKVKPLTVGKATVDLSQFINTDGTSAIEMDAVLPLKPQGKVHLTVRARPVVRPAADTAGGDSKNSTSIPSSSHDERTKFTSVSIASDGGSQPLASPSGPSSSHHSTSNNSLPVTTTASVGGAAGGPEVAFSTPMPARSGAMHSSFLSRASWDRLAPAWGRPTAKPLNKQLQQQQRPAGAGLPPSINELTSAESTPAGGAGGAADGRDTLGVSEGASEETHTAHMRRASMPSTLAGRMNSVLAGLGGRPRASATPPLVVMPLDGDACDSGALPAGTGPPLVGPHGASSAWYSMPQQPAPSTTAATAAAVASATASSVTLGNSKGGGAAASSVGGGVASALPTPSLSPSRNGAGSSATQQQLSCDVGELQGVVVQLTSERDIWRDRAQRAEAEAAWLHEAATKSDRDHFSWEQMASALQATNDTLSAMIRKTWTNPPDDSTPEDELLNKYVEAKLRLAQQDELIDDLQRAASPHGQVSQGAPGSTSSSSSSASSSGKGAALLGNVGLPAWVPTSLDALRLGGYNRKTVAGH